jgi:hypothetical protein
MGVQGPIGPSDGYSADSNGILNITSGDFQANTVVAQLQLPRGSYLVFGKVSIQISPDPFTANQTYGFVRCSLDGINYSEHEVPQATLPAGIHFALNVQSKFILAGPGTVSLSCGSNNFANTVAYSATVSAIQVGQLHLQ